MQSKGLIPGSKINFELVRDDQHNGISRCDKYNGIKNSVANSSRRIRMSVWKIMMAVHFYLIFQRRKNQNDMIVQILSTLLIGTIPGAFSEST